MGYTTDQVWDISFAYLKALYSYKTTSYIWEIYGKDNSHVNDPVALFKYGYYQDNWYAYLREVYDFFRKKADEKDPEAKELISKLKTPEATWFRITKLRHSVFHVSTKKGRLDAAMDLLQEGEQAWLADDLETIGEHIAAKLNGQYSYTPEEDEREFRWQMANATEPGFLMPKK